MKVTIRWLDGGILCGLLLLSNAHVIRTLFARIPATSCRRLTYCLAFNFGIFKFGTGRLEKCPGFLVLDLARFIFGFGQFSTVTQFGFCPFGFDPAIFNLARATRKNAHDFSTDFSHA